MRCRHVVSFFFGMSLASQAMAWGLTGHEIINAVAVDGLTGVGARYLKANRDHIQAFATVPDKAWRRNPSGTREAPLHFFHMDFYTDGVTAARMPMTHPLAAQSFTSTELNHNGKGLWRVEQMVPRLVQALQEGKCQEAVQVAGTLGHYVADLSQPMHASSDYDGQSIDRRGIHAHFETKMVAKWDRRTLEEAVKAKAHDVHDFDDLLPISDVGGILPLIYREGAVSISHMPRLTAIYASVPAGDKSIEATIKDELPAHMARGVFVLRKVWETALAMGARKGRSPCAGQRLDIPAPEWIEFVDDVN